MIRQQVFKYTVVGGLQVLIDAALLLLLVHFGAAVWLANVASRLLAAFVGYNLNKIWTFGIGSAEQGKHLFRFWVWWATATIVGSGILQIIDAGTFAPELLTAIKLMLELFLAVCTFIVFRFWVYKR